MGCWVNGAHPPTAKVAGYFGNSKVLSNINDKQPEADFERSFPRAFLLLAQLPCFEPPSLCLSMTFLLSLSLEDFNQNSQ